MKNISLFTLALLYSSVVVANEGKPTETPKTEFSGLIEVEAAFNDDGTNNTSDVSLATVELGISHQFSKKVRGSILFLYEEGENNDNIIVDEASINYQFNENTSISAGRMYLPFGNYETFMVSDPLVLDIGETREEAVQANFSGKSGMYGSVYTFKDDEDNSNKLDDYGFSLGYAKDNLSVGLSHISDVNDKSSATHSAKGTGIHATGSIGRATIIAEHLQADLGSETAKANNLEAGFSLNKGHTIGISVQNTDNAASLDLPEKAIGIAYSMPIAENAVLAAEYMKHDKYDVTDEDIITLQAAYEF